ncbi:MAG TPA: sodium-independent anion transporter, partial [Euzebyales bacterium]|nr:sodium-independent anion transporter [Euzebyales bacterium]
WPSEEDPPAEIPPDEIVVLQPYGSLFFAAAPIFSEQLPNITQRSHGAVVIIRLRGKEDIGSTFIGVVTTYAQRLHAAGARLLLAGVSEQVHAQLHDTGAIDIIGRDNVFPASPSVGEAVQQAMNAAHSRTDT